MKNKEIQYNLLLSCIALLILKPFSLLKSIYFRKNKSKVFKLAQNDSLALKKISF